MKLTTPILTAAAFGLLFPSDSTTARPPSIHDKNPDPLKGIHEDVLDPRIGKDGLVRSGIDMDKRTLQILQSKIKNKLNRNAKLKLTEAEKDVVKRSMNYIIKNGTDKYDATPAIIFLRELLGKDYEAIVVEARKSRKEGTSEKEYLKLLARRFDCSLRLAILTGNDPFSNSVQIRPRRMRDVDIPRNTSTMIKNPEKVKRPPQEDENGLPIFRSKRRLPAT